MTAMPSGMPSKVMNSSIASTGTATKVANPMPSESRDAVRMRSAACEPNTGITNTNTAAQASSARYDTMPAAQRGPCTEPSQLRFGALSRGGAAPCSRVIAPPMLAPSAFFSSAAER